MGGLTRTPDMLERVSPDSASRTAMYTWNQAETWTGERAVSRDEVIELANVLLGQAHALREAYPDVAAMSVVGIADLGSMVSSADPSQAALCASLRYVRDEMALVRRDGVFNLFVLDDEIAGAERCMGDFLK